MAENTSVELDTATGVDYADHASTYRGFVALVKYSSIAIAIVLILLAYTFF